MFGKNFVGKKGLNMADFWIEIDLDAVVHNYQEVVGRLSPGSRCMAVVKADGYGLGAVEVARALEEAGCEAFAVTTVDEALILRRNGIQGLILVLGPSSPASWIQALQENIQLTVSELGWISELEEICAENNREVEVHIKLETGMGRTGFGKEMLAQLAAALKEAPHLKVAGAYTHFARAAQRDRAYTRDQFEKFLACIQELEGLGISIPCKHVCNSAAFLDYPGYHLDFVRVGTLLVGHFPSPAFEGMLDLRDPWLAKTRIVHLRDVPRGTYVGYQSLYRSKKATKLAVIPVGYADGFGVEPRFVPQGIVDLGKIIVKNIASLFGVQLGREKLLLNGNTVRVAGKIGMQLTVLDVGNTDCALGDEVVVPLRRTLANPRIERFYRKNGKYFTKRIISEGFLGINTEYFNTRFIKDSC